MLRFGVQLFTSMRGSFCEGKLISENRVSNYFQRLFFPTLEHRSEASSTGPELVSAWYGEGS